MQLSWDKALKVVSGNPARIFRLHEKGSIETGKDADIILLDSEMHIRFLLANGTVMMKEGQQTKKGTFES